MESKEEERRAGGDGGGGGGGETEEILPETPQEWVFSREEFSASSFSVDLFVKSHRKEVSLEELREHLSTYLRTLRLALIDLINQDYADFVNLSSNLVGMDKSIHNLAAPLQTLREQVVRVQSEYQLLIAKVGRKMHELGAIKQQKDHLERVENVMRALERLQRLYATASNANHDSDGKGIPFHDLERMALEMEKVDNDLSLVTLDIPLVVDTLKPTGARLSQSIRTLLESAFFEAITRRDAKQFDCMLRVYALNGRNQQLEDLFRKRVVHQYMGQVICEDNLEKQGAVAFYEQILKFLDSDCDFLLQKKTKSNSYDFLLNSLWQEIATGLMTRTPSLFSPGNPDHFHSNYSATLQFSYNFASKCSFDGLQSVTQSDSFQQLMRKFNVQIYFHIRCQQIATTLEAALSEGLRGQPTNGLQSNSFTKKLSLKATSALEECALRCWSTDGVYLPPLFHSFWKLTLQLMSRFTVWLESVKTPGTQRDGSYQPEAYEVKEASLLFLLVNETEAVLKTIESYFETHIINLKPEKCPTIELRESVQESLSHVRIKGLPHVENKIKECLSIQCTNVLKQVNDIPRLYRKTNRDVPTKASSYVTTCVEVLANFIATSDGSEGWRAEWTREILDTITAQFKASTSDVLVSVQKMEDSLRRLKKVKGSQNQMKGGISDDDKIRMQLNIDVKAYCEKVEKRLNVKPSSIPIFLELCDLVKVTRNAL